MLANSICRKCPRLTRLSLSLSHFISTFCFKPVANKIEVNAFKQCLAFTLILLFLGHKQNTYLLAFAFRMIPM